MENCNNAASGSGQCKSICKKNDANLGFQTQLVKKVCETREKVAIGIDLGSSTCTVGVYQGGEVEIIINEGGNSPMPPSDVVGITEEGKMVRMRNPQQEEPSPKNAICDMMKTIRKGYYDKNQQHEMRMAPFRMLNVEGLPALEALCKRTDRRFTPVDVSSEIFRRVKEICECLLGKIVFAAVITVPVYFNEYERQATKEAANNAGLQVLRLLNEPVAAAMAYGFLKMDERKNALVFDFGGGTLDVSVFSIGYGVVDLKATSGNTRLGGKDIDSVLLSHFAKEIENEYGINILKNREAIEKLRSVSEEAKRCLSSHRKVVIKIRRLADEITFNTTLTRAKFDELNADLFNNAITSIEDVLEDANLSKEEISDIVLVGGSTKIPKIQSLIQEFFDGKELTQTINPEEVIAIGAALEAAVMGEDVIDKSTIELEYDTAPLSLGIKAPNGSMTIFVPKGTPLPCTVTHIFTTFSNNQTAALLQIFEGEKCYACDNEHLGNLELKGLPRTPRGILNIQVTFCVEKSGIIIVTAREETTHRQNALLITKNFRKLTKLEVDKMIRDSVVHKLKPGKYVDGLYSPFTGYQLYRAEYESDRCSEMAGVQRKKTLKVRMKTRKKVSRVHWLSYFIMK